MRKALIAAVALVVIGGAVAFLTGAAKLDLGVHSGLCQADDEIAASVRGPLEARAMAFTRAILSSKAADAYSMMADGARASFPESTLEAQVGVMGKVAGSLQDPHVSRTYFVMSTGSGVDARAICGTLADNKWASVEIKPGLNQGHVIVDVKARNNDWAFTYWLLPKGNDWQVEYFHAGTATMVGLTPDDLLKKARAERDAGHPFNATMLYAGVQGTTDYGPAFQLGIAQSLREDLGKLQQPAELSGKPPFDWKLGGTDYTVSQVTITGVAGKLGLIFMLPQKVWGSQDEVEKSNRAFLTAFMAAHPDYQRDFSFLVARALKPDNSGGFGTVYENGKGFD